MPDRVGASGLSPAFLGRPEAMRWVQDAFEYSPMPITLRDPEMNLTWANTAYTELMGRPAHDLNGQSVAALLEREHHSSVHEISASFAAQSSDEAHRRYRYERPDGSVIVAEVFIRALRSDDGEMQFFLSFLRDITDRVGLARQLELDDLVSSISADFIDVTPATVARSVKATLGRLGAFFLCHRVDLLESESDGGALRRSSAWSKPNVSELSADTLAAITEVDVVAQIDGADDSHASVLATDPSALLVIPIVRGDRVSDRLVFSRQPGRSWDDRELRSLSSIGTLLGGLYARIEAQIYLDVAFEDAPVGISVRSSDSTLLAANQAYADFLGYDSPKEMVGTKAAGMIASINSGQAARIPDAVHEMGTHIVDRMEFTRKDGTAAIGRVHAKRVGGLAEGELLILSHVEDLAAAAISEKALEVSQQRFRDLVENSPAITMLIDANLDITYAAPSIQKIGWNRHELEGRNVADLPPEAAAQLATEVGQVIAHGRPRHFDWAPQGADGEHWLRVAAVPELDAEGNTAGVIMVAVDDSARRKSQSELMHHAHHDPLTGLANRKALLDHLAQLMGTSGTPDLALFFLDVDRFKVVNDSLGHGAGDELIKKVAERLVASVRSHNLVARFGGDEFVIVVDGPLTEEQAHRISERIRDTLSPPMTIGEHELYVTVSIGIAFPGNRDVEQLISNADAAMYEAKEAGRNRAALHAPGVKQLSGERFKTESELRSALPRGEFEPFFQAEVDLETGELLGGEALIRWHHPQRGLLSAGEFISIAEDAGLISDIGDWVMTEACKVLRTWQSRPETSHLSMRVNLSANQLSERGVVDKVTRALEASGADPAGLCLEITETVLMADAEASLTVLGELRSLGLTLAIDDFGTGYSSLAYLKQFPVNILKIDRSFVDGLPGDANDLAIVKSIIGLATALGLDLVAEGVETEQQGASLLSMGCKRAQGYYFGRPIPLGEFETHQLFLDVIAAHR